MFPRSKPAILDPLKGNYELTLQKRVNHIQKLKVGVTLEFSDQDRRSFYTVAITIPLGLLKAGSIRFSPKSPARKQRALYRLGMGARD